MECFADFLAKIADLEHRARTAEVLAWVIKTFPSLEPKIAWNQPMFTDHGTFIAAFSVSKHHLAMSPEAAGISRFANEIKQSGYEYTTNLIRIPWKSQVDFALLEGIIAFNIEDKAGLTAFWRK